jgi:hypothetical protein
LQRCFSVGRRRRQWDSEVFATSSYSWRIPYTTTFLAASRRAFHSHNITSRGSILVGNRVHSA